MAHHQLLMAKETCQSSISWFPPNRVLRLGIQNCTMLQELYKTLVHLMNLLQDIRDWETDLNPSWEASLPKKLESARTLVTGLHSNIHSSLCRPTSVTPHERPKLLTFDRKIKGCQVLWNFSKLFKTLARSLKSREGNWKRGSRSEADWHLQSDVESKKCHKLVLETIP